MQIYILDEETDTMKLHIDRSRNTCEYNWRDEAEDTAKRLSHSHGTAQVRSGQAVLAEFNYGDRTV